MRVYRLSKEAHKYDLSGKGAEKYGGRWNSRGTRMLYTSDSRSLAMLEVAVHVPLNRIPRNYYMVTIDIPDELIQELDLRSLEGKNWKNNPPIKHTQTEGDRFVRQNEFLAIKVPSAVVDGDQNILVNPEHPDAKQLAIIEVEEFEFDMRLFK